jgi:enoyl-[acyl-carrier protein] reductase I
VGILEGKRILVTGVLTDDSLAFSAARLAQEEGAEVALTGFGRGMSLTTRAARKLPTPVEVYELDVTMEEQADQVALELRNRWGGLDGVVHAIGFAPENCLGKGVLVAGWKDVATAVEVSAYSLKVLAAAFAPLLSQAAGGGSIVGFDFDATVAWPGYDWMGVAKAALESLARYLARDLGSNGIRVNLVAAGPISTVAARSIPGFERFESVWDARAPLGWDVRDSEAVARACVALLSDWFPRTTGEIIHVDGGFHAAGA